MDNQNLHKTLVPMAYNNPYILSDQISGIFKGTWKNKKFSVKNLRNSNNNFWISSNNSENIYQKDTTNAKQQSNYPNEELAKRYWY